MGLICERCRDGMSEEVANDPLDAEEARKGVHKPQLGPSLGKGWARMEAPFALTSL